MKFREYSGLIVRLPEVPDARFGEEVGPTLVDRGHQVVPLHGDGVGGCEIDGRSVVDHQVDVAEGRDGPLHRIEHEGVVGDVTDER